MNYNDYKEIQIIVHGVNSFNVLPNMLNLFGIRTNTNCTNTFDDIIGCAYIDKNGNPQLLQFPGTTDPGLFYLEHPMNVLGTGILAPQFIKSFWTIGLHKGYQALIQQRKCLVYRDNDRDKLYDFTNLVEAPASCRCDLHRARIDKEETHIVDKWSALCQVLAKYKDFDYIMALVMNQKVKCKDANFNYTLWHNLVVA